MNKNILLKFLFLFFLFNAPAFSQNIDADLLKEINTNRNKKLDNIFNLFSNTTGAVGISTSLGIFTTGLINNSDYEKKSGAQIAVSYIGALAISYGLKHVINRPRPYETYCFIDNLDVESSPSMPSAHAAFAFATATSISLQYPKWYVIIPAAVWATGVSYSRMHIGVHFPSDVLVGAVVGSGVSILTYQLQKLLEKNY